MPLKKERNPARGHRGLINFLAAELTEENYGRLIWAALSDGRCQCHLVPSPGQYSLKNAQALQQRLTTRLEAVIAGRKLHLTIKDALLIRLHALTSARLPRYRWSRKTKINGRIKVFPHPVGTPTDRLLMSLCICPYGMPGCRRYFTSRALRPKRHCGNAACKNQHDKRHRTYRTA